MPRVVWQLTSLSLNIKVKNRIFWIMLSSLLIMKMMYEQILAYVCFAPMFYEELIVSGDEGRLRAWEQKDFLPVGDLQSHIEILCGENKPSRRIQPGYPTWIEDSGHNGATFYEHIYFVDNIEGKTDNNSFCS